MDINKAMRKWAGVILTAITYFIVHEGAHAIYALSIHAFEKINFLGLGIQVQINRSAMTNTQFGIFNLIGAAATILCGYLLLALVGKITSSHSKLFKAVLYYLTLGFLVIDPIYLTFVFKFVGGGDMNGIVSLMPQLTAQIIFGMILLVNVVLLFKVVVPKYKAAFALSND